MTTQYCKKCKKIYTNEQFITNQIQYKQCNTCRSKTKKCEFVGYKKIPTFNTEGETNARFCNTHKTAGMIDIKHRRCEFLGCKKRPTFNTEGETNARFCNTHKTAGMIDIKSRRCEFVGCKKIPTFGVPGYCASRCVPHKMVGMIKKSNSKCKKCRNLAIYGMNFVPTHCEKHKEDDELNLVERNCTSCNLLFVLDKDGFCEFCHPESFVTSRLAKQNGVMNYLNNIGLEGVTTDIVIDGGICGKERPDRVFDFGDKIVVLECDENQHKDRACECEQIRMMNIFNSFGGVRTYFIRWNPDDYKCDNECDTIKKRYILLGNLLEDMKNGRYSFVDNMCSVFYMYYDGWKSMSKEKWHVLL